MKIILLEDIKGLGRKNDIKNVSNGYVRNFLLPRKLAELATKEAIIKVSEIKHEEDQKNKRVITELEEKAEKIKKLVLHFSLRERSLSTKEEDQVFGSIGKHDIEKALEDKGFSNLKATSEKPLKSFGEHNIEVDLGKGVKAQVVVKITSSEKTQNAKRKMQGNNTKPKTHQKKF